MVLVALVAIMLFSSLIYGWSNFSVIKKTIGIIIFISVAILVVVYSMWQSNQDEKALLYQNAFIRGDSLVCFNKFHSDKEIEVNNKNFNLISGSLSFIGKGSMNGININIEDCHSIKEKKHIDEILKDLN